LFVVSPSRLSFSVYVLHHKIHSFGTPRPNAAEEIERVRNNKLLDNLTCILCGSRTSRAVRPLIGLPEHASPPVVLNGLAQELQRRAQNLARLRPLV
jgi:hypothetical protein